MKARGGLVREADQKNFAALIARHAGIWCALWVPAAIAAFGLAFGVDVFAPAPSM